MIKNKINKGGLLTIKGMMLFLKTVLIISLIFSVSIWGYEEGPDNSGRWVHGTVTYSDGSKCRNCCRIALETTNGFSKEGCTNNRGEYKIYVTDNYVKAVYYQGSKVCTGSKNTKGGVRIDIEAR
jgi:hypothetical protein